MHRAARETAGNLEDFQQDLGWGVEPLDHLYMSLERILGGRTWKNNKHCRRSVLLLPNQAKSIACAHPQPLLLQCGPKTVRQRLRNCKYELQHRLTHVSSMREREGEPWKTQKSTLSIRPDVDGMTSKQSRKWLHRTIYNFSATIASYHFQQAPPMILLALIPKAWN